jgi:hypothetical protein
MLSTPYDLPFNSAISRARILSIPFVVEAKNDLFPILEEGEGGLYAAVHVRAEKVNTNTMTLAIIFPTLLTPLYWFTSARPVLLLIFAEVRDEQPQQHAHQEGDGTATE